MFLKPTVRKDGYLEVKLYKDGERKGFLVHRLVAEAYIPNPDNLPQVNHIKEFEKDKNCISNLCWSTSKENVNYGTRNERAAEKFKKTIFCVELNKSFASASDAAKELAVSRSGISKCCCGTQKTAGGYHWRFAD